jgi:hypothetical protein
VFSQVYRTEATEAAVWAFREALADLAPSEINLACRQAIRDLKFFPTPAEIRNCLASAREKLASQPRRNLPTWEPETPEDIAAREQALEKLKEIAAKKSMPEISRTYTPPPKKSEELTEYIITGEKALSPAVIAATEKAIARYCAAHGLQPGTNSPERANSVTGAEPTV